MHTNNSIGGISRSNSTNCVTVVRAGMLMPAASVSVENTTLRKLRWNSCFTRLFSNNSNHNSSRTSCEQSSICYRSASWHVDLQRASPLKRQL